ncbi:N-acetyltransferase [Desulfovibrio ferrophilus]|uniref:Acetyltransferase n=1 Tax=Desulfovibrio ferrophilus TaxID=241368 RepID=A0A2Z6AXJ0_9BACT|nr:N-acetyltransferase [Desulfovibrio ferrophilus]BBD07866.1 acetyltransferase [Desulfovibrio ferrophilus]
MELYIRKARMQDVRGIHALLMKCADRQELLPRSLNDLYGKLRDFVVLASRDDEKVHGCCAFAICWEDIAEIRSLAVAPGLHGQGWGKRLVETSLSEAVMFRVYRVFTLTYVPGFFAKLGFKEVGKEVLPQKVWADCLNCPKFPECDEVAMILEL